MIEYKGYSISVREIKPSGMLELSTMAESMGEEYREYMTVDKIDNETLDKFIKYVEHNK